MTGHSFADGLGDRDRDRDRDRDPPEPLGFSFLGGRR
jgi:hypothetical protein